MAGFEADKTSTKTEFVGLLVSLLLLLCCSSVAQEGKGSLTGIVCAKRAAADGAIVLEAVIVRRHNLVQYRVSAEACRQRQMQSVHSWTHCKRYAAQGVAQPQYVTTFTQLVCLGLPMKTDPGCMSRSELKSTVRRLVQRQGPVLRRACLVAPHVAMSHIHLWCGASART